MNNFDLRRKMLSHFYFELPLFMSKVENLYVYGPLVIFLWITCPSSLPFFCWVVFFMLICGRFRKLAQLYSKIIKLSIFSYSTFIALFQASLVTQRVRNPSIIIGRLGLIPGLGRSPREGMATPFLPGEFITWTEETGEQTVSRGDCDPRGHKESDMTERPTHTQLCFSKRWS